MTLFKRFETSVVGRTSDWGGFIGVVVLGYGAVSGIIAGVAKQLTRFGEIRWPEAVFIGLGASAILMLVIGAFLLMWRVFRPLTSSAKAKEPLEIPRLGEEEIERRKLLEAVAEEVKALKRAAEVERGTSDEALSKAVQLIQGEKAERTSAIAILAKQYAGWISEVRQEAFLATDVLGALGRRELAEQRKTELDRRAGEIDANWDALVKVLEDPAPFSSVQWQSEFIAAQNKWDGAVREAEILHKDATGEWIEMRQHPNDMRNQHAPVTGDARITDDAKRQEFRRLVDESEHVKKYLTAFAITLQGEINQATNRIYAYAGGSPLSPLPQEK